MSPSHGFVDAQCREAGEDPDLLERRCPIAATNRATDPNNTMNELQAALEASPNAVLVVDDNGVIRRANRNVSDVLGYESNEIEGMVVEDLLRDEDRTNHVEYREAYMEDPESRPMGRELDLYALRKDGTEIPVEISLGPIERDGDLHILATIADITKRKERERAIREEKERLDEFASVVSHDLRNPLNIASGRLELARESVDSEHIEEAITALDRMEALISDLLTLAREGRAVDDVERLDFESVVATSWASVETGDATLNVDVDRLVRANQSRLRQLLENLFRNAIEHGGEDVTVEVGELPTGFYVADDGPGIPSSERNAVFEAGHTTTEEEPGFGLSIVREIALGHGWDINLTESAAGGARFEFTGVES